MKTSSLFKMALLTLGFSLLTIINASAITYQDSANVEFTFNPTINLSLSSSDLTIPNLAPGSASDSNVITATVSTNAGYGYYLSATAGTAGGNTNLTNTADSTYNFASLSSNAATLSAIPDNKWGYSYSTDNGTTWISGDNDSALAGYNGLPLDADDSGATGVKLLSSDSFAGTGSVQFKIGARASSDQVSGTYTGTVNFYAVTNPAPVTFNDAYAAAGKEKSLGYYKMQDATSAICTAVDEGQVGQVIDTRDNTIYHIGKLADGKCWLLDNLALDLTNSAILNGLSSTNTNIDPNNETTILTSLKNGNRSAGGQYATGGLTNWTSSYSYSVPMVNMASKDVVPQGDDPIATTVLAGNWKVGGYYNYCAASAGSYCYDHGTGSGDATEDICPKGWHIPTGGSSGEYLALYNNISYHTYTGYRSVLRLPLSGFFRNGGQGGQGGYSYFWSATYFSSDHMYDLDLDTNTVHPGGGDYRDYGNSVRCVLGS